MIFKSMSAVTATADTFVNKTSYGSLKEKWQC